MKEYSVLLLYPVGFWPHNTPETYYNFTIADSAEEAVQKVRQMAIAANGDRFEFTLKPQDFSVLAVMEGHIELELGAADEV